MKIRIIGASGSGKTHLGRKISEKLKIPVYDIDDILWKEKYSQRRTQKEIESKINKILKHKNWIIEGLEDSRHILEKTFKKADKIIWANPNILKINYRLFKRFLSRLKNKEENSKDTLRLMKWSTKYKLNLTNGKKQHNKIHKENKNKIIILKNNRQVNKFLKELK